MRGKRLYWLTGLLRLRGKLAMTNKKTDWIDEFGGGERGV